MKLSENPKLLRTSNKKGQLRPTDGVKCLLDINLQG